jgi:hypothetical protein
VLSPCLVSEPVLGRPLGRAPLPLVERYRACRRAPGEAASQAASPPAIGSAGGSVGSP